MLASMNEIDAVNWSDQGVNGLLPTGTVTLLLADVEGSTRLWQTLPEEMTAAVENLDGTLADLVSAHRGVRPVEQGEGGQRPSPVHPTRWCVRWRYSADGRRATSARR